MELAEKITNDNPYKEMLSRNRIDQWFIATESDCFPMKTPESMDDWRVMNRFLSVDEPNRLPNKLIFE